MAKKSEQSHVVLVDPDGNEHRATFPAEVNNLIFGSGYKLKDAKLTVTAAIEQLADTLDDDGQLPVSATEVVVATPASAPSTPSSSSSSSK